MNVSANRTAPHRNWFQRFLICCISFFIVLGILGLVWHALGMEPFGTKTVSIDDAKIQYIDFFTYYADVLAGKRTLTYDFANMLGGSSLGLFSYYLASPFNLLLYYFGKEGVYRFFNMAAALKLATAGSTFSWYLQRRFEDRIRPVFVIALSMGYALMQYSVAQSSNLMWLDGVYMLPLILLGVYETLHKKSVWRLSLAAAFCILCNWYIAGVSCLFSGIWFLFEFFFCGGSGRKIPEGAAVPLNGELSGVSGPYRQRGPASGLLLGITDFVVSFCRYVWGMGLGIAISAVLFLPAVSAMRQGKGQYEEIKVLMEMSGDLLSAVRGYVIGAQSERGFAVLFCGGIAVFTAAALLFSASVRIREKIAFLGLAGVCFLMLQWEPAMLAFSLLKRADSYWYRYSYLVCFALLFGAGAYLSRAEEDRWSRVFVVLLSALYAAAVLKLNGIHLAEFMARRMDLVKENPAVFATAAASVLLSFLTLLLLCVKRVRLIRILAGLLLLLVTGAELGANALLFWRGHLDDSQALYMEYSEGLQNQLKQLRALDDGYYRIAQDRTRWHYEDDLTAYFNDSLAQNYWSNAAYTSSPENAQLSLMWRLGYRDEAGCMLIVRDPILASDSFLGVKYMLESTPVQGLERVEGIAPFNGRSVYRNPFALPMAFIYSGEKLPTMRYENTYMYQNALFSTLSGKRTELYRPLDWTRYNEGNKSYFRVYIPEGEYLAYGNLLWPEKMSGLLSINGDEPFGYCRWMSPASFLIRSRQEQAASEEDDSLQAAAAALKADELKAGNSANSAGNIEAGDTKNEGAAPAGAEKTAAAGAEGTAAAGEETVTEGTEKAAAAGAEETAAAGAEGAAAAGEASAEAVEKSETQLWKEDLAGAAAAFDREALTTLKDSGYADVRTVVFRTEKGLTFKDYQFYCLDLEALREASDRIRAGEVTDVVIENGSVTCKTQGRRGSSLCLLVPWSRGWQALRNGEPVQPDTVAGTMITIPLIDGDNEIALTYTVPYLREGAMVSAAALGVLLVDVLCRLIAGRRRAKAAKATDRGKTEESVLER